MNQILAQVNWLKIKEPIARKTISSGAEISGLITVTVAESVDDLEILIRVSESFPLGEIRFIGQNFSGYPHQMPLGWICLNAELSPNLGPRFELELDKFRLWIQKYYVDKEQDEHYEYPTIGDLQPLLVVFEEDVDNFTQMDDFGKFEYRQLKGIEKDGKRAESWIVTKLGRRKSRWSDSFVNSLEHEQDGLYVLLDRAPLGNGRQVVETWQQLIEFMSEAQRSYLYDNRFNVKPNIAIKGAFIVLIGYPIIDGDRKELHWLPIYVFTEQFPYKAVKTGPGKWTSKDLGLRIAWGTSENASYQRLFGRGQLTDKVTNKKILILGVGAIGSTLFMSLVRGGCRFVDIQDGDFVMTGNVTRGQFEFNAVAFSKVDELVSEALRISPYLNITGTSTRFTPQSPGSGKFEEERRRLNCYDLIFDCTSDKLLSVTIDKMQLNTPVYNLSLTNGATHLAWITGYGNIHLIKSSFFARLEEPEQKNLFIAQGCWYPTFKATNVDVQILVNFGLKEFLRIKEEGGIVPSFYIECHREENDFLGYKIKRDV